jgi:23S rRNA (pseudouridine1915-N3)-methyltransferase
MSTVHLICVGKLKDKNLEVIEENYLKRLKNLKLKIHEVKSHAESREQEADIIRKKLKEINQNQVNLVLLREWGKQFTSVDFSKWLYLEIEKNQGPVVLVIGGAEGFCPSLVNECQSQLSLSALTYPHKLARIVLVEQIYRAVTIKEGHPYHN